MRLDIVFTCVVFFFFQAEDGIRDLVRSRGLGDVYKRQADDRAQVAGVGHLVESHDESCFGGERVVEDVLGLSLIHI